MEEARLAREQRQRDRALSKSVLVLQSVWRGRREGRQYWRGHRAAFDKRVADLAKVATVLAARTPPHDFVVPPKVLFPLLRQFCAFATSRSRRGGRADSANSTARLPALCALVAKSIAQRSAETNITSQIVAAPACGVALSLARLCLRSVFRPVADLAGTERPVLDVLQSLTRFGGAGAGARDGFPQRAPSDSAEFAALRSAVAKLHRRICPALLAPPCAVVEELRRAALGVKPVWQSKRGRCVEAAPVEWALALLDQEARLEQHAYRALARRVLAIPALAARLDIDATRLLGEEPRFASCPKTASTSARSPWRPSSNRHARFIMCTKITPTSAISPWRPSRKTETHLSTCPPTAPLRMSTNKTSSNNVRNPIPMYK